MVARLTAKSPYGMLAMQPVFARCCCWMFAGSGRRYAEHFVFSLHSHSLWFLALADGVCHPDRWRLLMLAVFAHGVAALRRVYGRGRSGALWRGVLLSIGYFVLIVFWHFVLLVAGIVNATAHVR